MVAGDVFRSPKNATLLCVQLGSGVQIILSSFITLFFAALGRLSQISLSQQLHYTTIIARSQNFPCPLPLSSGETAAIFRLLSKSAVRPQLHQRSLSHRGLPGTKLEA